MQTAKLLFQLLVRRNSHGTLGAANDSPRFV
jgi:hypothetical protein